jgi:enediyne biosynthesis protein E4
MNWVSRHTCWVGSLLAISIATRAKSASNDMANFVDVAAAIGVTAATVVGDERTKDYILETTGGGVAVLDYDGDGRQDVFVVNGARRGQSSDQSPTSHLYRNAGDGTFTDVTTKAGLTARGWGQAACAGDIDNDGDLDLLVTYYGRLVLYRSNGDGTFTDASATSGLPVDRPRWNTGAAFLDVDRDGRLDLFVSAYVAYDDATRHAPGSRRDCFWKGMPVMCGPQGLAGSQNALFRGQGDGTFVDVSEKAGLLKPRPAFGFTPLVLDYDNDGWSDVYVANDSSASLLFHNDKAGGFTEVGLRAGVALTADGRAQAGMGVGAADYDRDGWLDIVKTNFDDDTTSLYRNLGDGTFEDATLAAGLGGNTRFLGWGTGFLDVDRDGWPDLFSVNGHVYPQADQVGGRYSYRQRKVLYRNGGAGRFEDVSERSGPGILAATAARGAAVGDLFGTGRQDIVVNNMHAPPSLLHDCKSTDTGYHAIAVQLVGTRSNRSALGARVTVVADGRRLIDEVRSGGSFGSQHGLALFFGLGTRAAADRIEVTWPSGTRDVVAATPGDRLVVIEEGGRIVRQEPFVARRVPGCPAS